MTIARPVKRRERCPNRVSAKRRLAATSDEPEPANGVEHEAARCENLLTRRQQHRERFLRRVQTVAALGPGDHITDRACRRLRIAFGEQMINQYPQIPVPTRVIIRLSRRRRNKPRGGASAIFRMFWLR